MSFEPWIEHDKRLCKNKESAADCPGRCGSSFVVRWRDEEKKKYRDGQRWDTAREANKRMEFLAEEQKRNAMGFYKEVTLREALDIFAGLFLPTLQSDESRQNYKNLIARVANSELGPRTFNKITYKDVAAYWQGFLERHKTKNTAVKHTMLLHSVYERFRRWNAMVPQMIPQRIALPEFNPVKVAKEYLEMTQGRGYTQPNKGRERILDRHELLAAKEWCIKNDPSLWEAIKMAIKSTLRKSDLTSIEPGMPLKGVQKKTGREFDLPLTMPQGMDFKNLRYRWDLLRASMGWHRKGPDYVTWHDLRHCGPSILASMGTASKIIQQVLGHSTERMAERYTHAMRERLRPAIEALNKEIDAI